MFVDVSVIAQRDSGTGIQRVVRGILDHLPEAAAGQYLIVPVTARRRAPYRCLGEDNAPLWTAPLYLTARPGDVFLGLDYTAHLASWWRRWELRSLKRRGVRLAYVVYDLLPALHPGWFSPRGARHHARWLSYVVPQADLAMCISKVVAEDLTSCLASSRHKAPPTVATFQLGSDIAASRPSSGLPPDAAQTLEWVRARPTVLMVGTIEPRKGHDDALAALERMWERDGDAAPALLLVGRPGWKTDDLQSRLRNHPLCTRHLRWLPDVSDEFLEMLYPAAAGLLVASRGEGFGLPLLEAARHSRPILARDLPVLREVAPAGTRFFTEDAAPEALATAITDWLAAPPTLPERPPATTSWSQSARELVAAICSAFTSQEV